VGSATYVSLELLKDAKDANLVHIAYRGGGAGVPDLMAGNVDGLPSWA
jgi:tripartite-type tricarboxylate transporter receptor subunit TctC